MATARRLPRYLGVLDALRGDTVGGTWQGRLPPEPELAQRYGVSRTTLRRAIAALVEEGVLQPRHGSGTYIREAAPGPVRTVGMLVAPGLQSLADDPYMQQLMHHLLLAFTRHGWTLRLAPSSGEMGLRLAAGQGAPVVACVAALFGRGAVDALLSLPVPLVLVDSEPLPSAPVILADNAAGMAAAVARAAALGHRRIAHLAGPRYAAAGRERLQGFRDGMAAAGLAIPEGAVRQDDFSPDNGARAMAAWWALPPDERPTAVLCANDLMALGAMRWLTAHGLRPGREVSVVGCDDLLAARLAWPGLTTLALDFAAHAEAVVQAVLTSDRPGIRRTPLTLVERESLGPPA